MDQRGSNVGYATVIIGKNGNDGSSILSSDKLSNDMVEVQIPLSSILEVHTRFEFNLYGYFVGKRVVFSVVEHYVRNAWKKMVLFVL